MGAAAHEDCIYKDVDSVSAVNKHDAWVAHFRDLFTGGLLAIWLAVVFGCATYSAGLTVQSVYAGLEVFLMLLVAHRPIKKNSTIKRQYAVASVVPVKGVAI